VIDLSGPPQPWPAVADRLWAGCASDAVRGSEEGGDLLREELSSAFGLDPEHVTITPGARVAALAYGLVCGAVALERPTFTGVAAVLSAARVRWRYVTWSQIDDVPPGTLLWITSPCRNPDGASIEADVLARCRRAGRRVVINATNVWFTDDPLPAVPGAEIVLSLHKLAGREARIALVHSPHFAAEAASLLPGLAPAARWQHTWALFIRRGGLDLLRARVPDMLEAREEFTAEMDEYPISGAGPNVLLRLRAGVGEEAATALLLARGFKVLEGRHFASPVPAIRVNFVGVPARDAARFARVLRTTDLLAAVSGYPTAGRLGGS
jgi:DNA-binding transcriptional MocR family regulator